jgi:hypothetical protein
MWVRLCVLKVKGRFEDHLRLIVSLPQNEVSSFISRGAAWALSASEGRNYMYLYLASKFVIHERTSFFYMPQSWDMGQILYFPSEGRYAEEFFIRSGANPRSLVPEASMLTTRPPKPLCVCYVSYLLNRNAWNKQHRSQFV